MKSKSIVQSFLFILLFQSSICIFAQSEKPLSFGAKIGMASSGFTHNYQVFTNDKLGPSVGGFCELRPIDIFGIEFGLNYVQTGAHHVDPGYFYTVNEINIGSTASINISKVNTDITLHTLNIPLLFNFHPKVSGDVAPKFTLGFQLDWIFSAKATNWLRYYNTTYNIWQTTEEVQKGDVTSRVKSINYGPVAGCGVEFKSDALTYSIELRYSIGLNDINNFGSYNYVTSNTSRYNYSNNTLMVIAGISF
jgi:hypothetical protein